MRPTAAALVLLSSMTAHADVTIRYQADGEALTQIQIGAGQMRIDTGTRNSVIYAPDEDTMTVLDHDERRYTVIGPAERAHMLEAQQQMEKAMADMPPELRAQMQSMIKGAVGGDGKVELAETGATDQVGGIGCKIIETRVGAKRVSEMCVADVDAIGGFSAADRRVLAAVAETSQRMIEQLQSGPLGGMISVAPLRADHIPLRSTDYSAGRASSVFVGVSEGVAADAFAIPQRYKAQRLR